MSDLLAPRRSLGVLAVATMVLVGCDPPHPGAGIADKIRAVNSPIVREVEYGPGAFPDSSFDRIVVYLVDGATDAQALDLWCTVVVPAGVSQLPTRAVQLHTGGLPAPGGGRLGSKLVLTDPVVCSAGGAQARGG